jgi:hypothetical protein
VPKNQKENENSTKDNWAKKRTDNSQTKSQKINYKCLQRPWKCAQHREMKMMRWYFKTISLVNINKAHFFPFFFAVLGLELRVFILNQPFSVMGFFQDRVSKTICLGWLWTMILLISASWVARITDVSTGAWLKVPIFMLAHLVGILQYLLRSKYLCQRNKYSQKTRTCREFNAALFMIRKNWTCHAWSSYENFQMNNGT